VIARTKTVGLKKRKCACLLKKFSPMKFDSGLGKRKENPSMGGGGGFFLKRGAGPRNALMQGQAEGKGEDREGREFLWSGGGKSWAPAYWK